MWKDRRIVLGVTGGIAAYKSVTLAREWTRRGAAVDVVLTRGAARFVGAPTFHAVTGRAVHRSLWSSDAAFDHLRLTREADLVVIAPATAASLARAAAGLADDLLSTLLLANTRPVLVAPAMNDAMFAHPATAANLAMLRDRGWHVAGPAVGALAEGPSDRPGRMVEPAEIMAHAARIVRGPTALTELSVLVTAGPTREPIDPVRMLTNRSSGKMGYRLAGEAWLRGARVTLISGPVAEMVPCGVEVVRVETTSEMAAAVGAHLPLADVFIMAAAPADFTIAAPATDKLSRAAGNRALDLVPTPDILLTSRGARREGATIVGFALETGNAVSKGRDKLHRKALDMIVVNDALQAGVGFETETNAVTILDRRGGEVEVALADKATVAACILDAVERYRG